MNKSNEKGTVLNIKKQGNRREVIVTDRLLVSRFGADSNADSIIKTLSKHLAFLTWMANEVVPAESVSFLLDLRTFDQLLVQAAAWSSIERTEAPLHYREATALALACLKDTKQRDGQWDMLAAVAAFLAHYTPHVLPGEMPISPQSVRSWLYHVALCSRAWQ